MAIEVGIRTRFAVRRFSQHFLCDTEATLTPTGGNPLTGA